MSGLPQATIRWHARQQGPSKGAEVLVDGNPVAWLPVRAFAYNACDPDKLPTVTLELAAFDADVTTYDPARVRTTHP